MITMLTALHDLIHLGQFSAQRQEKKEESEQKNGEGGRKKIKARKTNRLTKKR